MDNDSTNQNTPDVSGGDLGVSGASSGSSDALSAASGDILAGANAQPNPLFQTTNSPITGTLQAPPPTLSTLAPASPSDSTVQAMSPGVPPAPQGTPSVWKNLVMGAIWGLAGSAGSKHFGGGLAGGAAGYLQGKQQEVENAQRQQQLQFESIRAADSHIAALDEHKRADQLSEESKVDYKMKSAQYQNFLQDSFGIEPNLSFNDSSTEANAGLQTLANQNGGSIPSVATIQQPSPDGQHGQIAAYSPSQEQMRQNANGFRNLINTQRSVQGQPEIDNATFNSLGFKGQRDAAQAAIEFLKPTPSFSLDKNKPDYLPNVLAQKQQQLQQYSQHKDINGNTDADPNVERQLSNGITYLQQAWDNSNKMENKAQVENINATSPAKAEAARQEDIAKQNTPQGRATLAKTQQETINAKYSNAAASTKVMWETGQDPVTGQKLNLSNAPDEMLVDPTTGNPIPFKMLSTLKPTQQESNRADFAKSTLHSLDLIDGLRAAGKVPNGPISGWTTKALIKAGVSEKDAAEVYGLIALTQSAATGAHVGGRFSAQIMDKMNGLLTLNSNDSQFSGQEQALRDVMTPYAVNGGRETVGQYKANLKQQQQQKQSSTTDPFAQFGGKAH